MVQIQAVVICICLVHETSLSSVGTICNVGGVMWQVSAILNHSNRWKMALKGKCCASNLLIVALPLQKEKKKKKKKPMLRDMVHYKFPIIKE